MPIAFPVLVWRVVPTRLNPNLEGERQQYNVLAPRSMNEPWEVLPRSGGRLRRPWFIVEDEQMFRYEAHPLGLSSVPAYLILGRSIVPTTGYASGPSKTVHFRIIAQQWPNMGIRGSPFSWRGHAGMKSVDDEGEERG